MLKKLLLVFAILAAATAGYAQEVTTPDWEQIGANAIQALVVPLTVIFVWASRKLIPVMPRAMLPLLAVVLGFGLDWLLAFVAGGTFSPIIGALLGASAVWLREFTSTIKEHGGSA